MDADFSEFSYGYAAIREAEVGLGAIYKLAGAPKLPSLIEEENLGWDVHLPFVDYALFLQFKRSVFVSRMHPDSPTWFGVGAPHYRYSIDTDGHQHRALLKLQSELAKTPGVGDVYYSAPIFHRQFEFDSAYSAGSVLKQSALVPPSDFGSMDGKHHFVATSPGASFIMSEPREAENEVTWTDLEGRLREKASRAAQRQPSARISIAELDEKLRIATGSLDRDIQIAVDASALDRLHRAAAILGCGLALVAVRLEGS